MPPAHIATCSCGSMFEVTSPRGCGWFIFSQEMSPMTDARAPNPSPAWDALWVNVHLATMAQAAPEGYGEIRDGAIAVRDGCIAWLGLRHSLPAGFTAAVEHDGHGAW